VIIDKWIATNNPVDGRGSCNYERPWIVVKHSSPSAYVHLSSGSRVCERRFKTEVAAQRAAAKANKTVSP
jgi:hypothetical protein